MRRILVLRGGALGDFVVTLPALLALRTKWPDAEIELIGNAAAAELATRRGLLDRAYSQHEARWGELYELRISDCGSRNSEEPESHRLSPHEGAAAVDNHNASRLESAQSAIRNPQSAIGRSSLRPWLSTFDLVVNYWPDPEGELGRNFPAHEGQRFVGAPAMPDRSPAAIHYAEPLREFGIAVESSWCRIEPDRIVWGRTNPATRTVSPTVAIHPGSGSLQKNWPLARWRELIARLGAPVLLILGEAELERWGPMSPSGFGANVRVLANAPLEQLVSALRHCRLFLGHDSGVSHLATACDVPSVLLFGPTDPATWAPPAPHVRVLRKGLDLSTIGVDEVLEAAQPNPETVE